MKIGVSPLERAFQLARSGKFASLDEIKKTLKFEGYSVAEIDGRVIHKQLRDIIKALRDKAAAAIPGEDFNVSPDK